VAGASEWKKEWPFLRDVVLFVCGIAGIAHETLVSPVPDPSLLILFGGMAGLPAFLRKDEKP
jgi:NhaP-type Na+/H+ or K+/H+ antiporter